MSNSPWQKHGRDCSLQVGINSLSVRFVAFGADLSGIFNMTTSLQDICLCTHSTLQHSSVKSSNQQVTKIKSWVMQHFIEIAEQKFVVIKLRVSPRGNLLSGETLITEWKNKNLYTFFFSFGFWSHFTKKHLDNILEKCLSQQTVLIILIMTVKWGCFIPSVHQLDQYQSASELLAACRNFFRNLSWHFSFLAFICTCSLDWSHLKCITFAQLWM